MERHPVLGRATLVGQEQLMGGWAAADA
jgi:hypothetical protein